MLTAPVTFGPNVTGNTSPYISTGTDNSGALYTITGGQYFSYYGGSTIANKASINFDASCSNSVYTDSGKIYPLSLALNFIIKC